MRKLVRRATLLVLPALLIGCSKDAIVATVSCEIGNHISVSKQDKLTEQTASEIEKNNRAREAGGCPAPKPETLRLASKP